MTSIERPLTGIRVLDLSRVLAGPLCAMNLGDMGADVIKVERPGTGDDTRGWGPPFTAGESAYFLCANRNKRSITLDLARPRGLDILRALVVKADVVIENFKVGTLARWGLTADWFASNAPQVITCSITGYGARGPKAQLPGYDFLAQAECGLMSITGAADGPPVKFGVSVVDFCTGQFATSSILAALVARGRTGRGQHIEASLYATGLSMLVNVAASHLMSERPAQRYGNGHPNAVPYREFVCADGEIALPIGNDAQFARLCGCLGHHEWAADPRFETMAQRVEHRDQVDAMLAQALKAKSADAWLALFQAAGIPCSKINSVEGALADPHTLANDMVVAAQHPTAGQIRMVGIPYRLSDTPAGIDRTPPVLGADTEDVLMELADVSAAEIAALRSDGVI